jgi:hypothetical protein
MWAVKQVPDSSVNAHRENKNYSDGELNRQLWYSHNRTGHKTGMLIEKINVIGDSESTLFSGTVTIKCTAVM